MTWEETIINIRKQPEFAELVKKAYFDENLILNVERFKSSKEYSETKNIISTFFPFISGIKILDIGSGNGISAISFALDGYEVKAVEPDKSDTVGSGAIRKLIGYYNLSNISVEGTVGEKLPFVSESFDILYIRQAMHHANDLTKFVNEAARVLKKGGLFFTVRDHVVYNQKDKEWFLDNHPLQKYYGGENAFTFDEYCNAIQSSGLAIKKIFKHFDSVINYFPMEENEIERLKTNRKNLINTFLRQKLPLFLTNNSFVKKCYSQYIDSKLGPALNEAAIPGRLYSFIAVKPV